VLCGDRVLKDSVRARLHVELYRNVSSSKQFAVSFTKKQLTSKLRRFMSRPQSISSLDAKK